MTNNQAMNYTSVSKEVAEIQIIISRMCSASADSKALLSEVNALVVKAETSGQNMSKIKELAEVAKAIEESNNLRALQAKAFQDHQNKEQNKDKANNKHVELMINFIDSVTKDFSKLIELQKELSQKSGSDVTIIDAMKTSPKMIDEANKNASRMNPEETKRALEINKVVQNDPTSTDEQKKHCEANADIILQMQVVHQMMSVLSELREFQQHQLKKTNYIARHEEKEHSFTKNYVNNKGSSDQQQGHCP